VLKSHIPEGFTGGTCCEQCPDKKLCTKGKARTVTIDSRDSLQTKMREKLKEDAGKKEYQKRSAPARPCARRHLCLLARRMFTVEPIFGNMQKNNGWRQFHLRGEDKTKGEFGLHCIAHNLKKIALHFNKLGVDLQTAIENMTIKYSLLY